MNRKRYLEEIFELMQRDDEAINLYFENVDDETLKVLLKEDLYTMAKSLEIIYWSMKHIAEERGLN